MSDLECLVTDGTCPDCRSTLFRPGPRGGSAWNLRCAQCHSCFWFSPPFDPKRIEDIGAEFYSKNTVTIAQIQQRQRLLLELAINRWDMGEVQTHPDLYAYVGEDELGSGRVGLKQADMPAGRIPLVVVADDLYKIVRAHHLPAQLQMQANAYKKPIRLVRYVALETIAVINPREPDGT